MENQQELDGIAQSIGIRCAKEMANGPYLGSVSGKNRHYLIEALEVYSEKGKTLEFCCGPKILNRARSTLEGYCRQAKIKFIDYVPLSMREKK